MSDALTLEVMRKLLRRGLGGLEEEDLSDEDADLYLNLSLWHISDKFNFREKECLVESTVVQGRDHYTLPDPLDAVHSVSVIDPSTGKSKKLIKIDWHRYEQLRDEGKEDSESHQGSPQQYVRFSNTLYIHPVPDGEYRLRLATWRTIASLVEGEVDTIDLPRNWQEMVIEGAITRGHYYHEDYTAAQQADNFRVGHERSAVLARDKEGLDNRFARLRVIDEFPDDPHEDFPPGWKEQMAND